MHGLSDKASTVCAPLELSEKALRHLKDEMPVSQYLQKLTDAKLYRDGVRVLSRILSERQLVWWGCVAIEHFLQPAPGPEREALGAAVIWVVEPGDEARQEASALGEPLTVRSPCGAIALAACWCDNAIEIARRVVPSTILIAASESTTSKRKEREAEAFTIGMDVLSHQLDWA